MIAEVVTMWATWLRHPTHGLVALLPQIDPPSTTIATVANIYDEVSDSVAARLQMPDDSKLPAVCVSTADVVSGWMQVQPFHNRGEVEIATRYILRDSDTKSALQACSRVERALRESRRRFLTVAGSESSRGLHGVAIYEARDWRFDVFRSPDDTVATLGVLSTFLCNDPQPIP